METFTYRNDILDFAVGVQAEKRADDCWSVYIEPPGMTIYAPTLEDLPWRALVALDFWLLRFKERPDGAARLTAYLDRHEAIHA